MIHYPLSNSRQPNRFIIMGINSLKENLIDIIQTVCSVSPQEPETTDLIKLCIRISYAYLKYKISIGYHICENVKEQKKELSELAVDAIAELFERDNKGQFTQLKRYFNPIINDVQNTNHLFILLRKLVTQRTEQYLFQVYKQRNPEHGKLLASLKAQRG